ncbi:alpha,alpha-trehalose-phosphate synthase (UDP-forming) [Terricaulis sp.]|uniref:alpha,alpha-trehalose-phosphate synthase (UDP-forming) n=1 Tax=Terricaulis sp. TaxID=2768686 RepID=UPI002AC529B3|nr:trehalose-6-phosphate synthase [Terricaulis sp.]MDZ4691806.1 trehalose-6-phosphate synthase [Terricaulis sp.]
MSRLIVVSNRVTPPGPEGASSQGGLAMAMSAALREYSGIWFGWSGQSTPEFTGEISMQSAGGVTVATMDLEEQDIQEYYNGYANGTLWPLFHYRIDLTQYERSFGAGYERVNARFADMLMPLIEPDDLIWVQDYHLIPLGRALRERGAKNAIGFFLHIPWPARELMATLPQHRQLVEAMFHYDVVGFHTDDWKNAFNNYVLHEVGGMQLTDGSVRAFGRTTLPRAFPIGIDAKGFAALKQSDAGIESYTRMTESKAGRKMLLGVDRLDYSKGIDERLLAYERLLNDSPELKRQIFMLQISTATRTALDAYQDIFARLDSISGRINGSMAEMDWIPIRNVHRMHSREELAGIYRAADVGLVTPLRDGMNLVAKEFVAGQDEDDPGVLVLSRFAGAASQMREALIVNPFSQEDVADGIRRALAMPKDERKRRWRALMDGVERDDVVAWRDSFVQALESARDGGRKKRAPRIAATRGEG